MKWKHIKPLDKDGQPTVDGREIAAAKIIVYGGDDEEYFSFITPETYYTLKDWMDFRAENGEDITGESPLMRDLFPFKYGKPMAQNPVMMKSDSVRKIVERALKEQGIRKPLNGAKRYEFKTAPINVETLMDHSVQISNHYYRTTEQDCFRIISKP